MKFSGILIRGWFVAGAAVTLAACSSSSEPKPDQAVPSPMPSTGQELPAECATGTDLAHELSDPRVTQVEVVGDCHSIAVSTALTGQQVDLALLVCASAAELAYADQAVTAVDVLGESGQALAASTRDQACAAA
ncbi:hypothetical protein [Kineosporia babensis]|uniref:Uncharacterized protein n=1 Tax=Kineosporia babensis TaxID=499548 RepID=A0A9X1NAD0_9ACTN|nr:hypothetical protein [Kineosporia babensis]MCD5310099.1 hypothetical protein [Kineosporia babensis]